MLLSQKPVADMRQYSTTSYNTEFQNTVTSCMKTNKQTNTFSFVVYTYCLIFHHVLLLWQTVETHSVFCFCSQQLILFMTFLNPLNYLLLKTSSPDLFGLSYRSCYNPPHYSFLIKYCSVCVYESWEIFIHAKFFFCPQLDILFSLSVVKNSLVYSSSK